MSDNVYAITEVVGSSSDSIEDAIDNAVTTATQTLRNLEWFEVGQVRGHIVDGQVEHYQVYVRLGLRYERK
ncbi:dodecin [Shumkonia mesophila]|uniref:dodecin n=1 Tax=Shumkonia mesophila TaxID=2838854 RepID=UPI0029342C72|nr:dodecin [Shumkonia mesophila]